MFDIPIEAAFELQKIILILKIACVQCKRTVNKIVVHIAKQIETTVFENMIEKVQRQRNGC